MARITVYIPDELLEEAVKYAPHIIGGKMDTPSVSGLVQEALRQLVRRRGRPETSQRGHLETVWAIRTATTALEDLERGLLQDRPVKRRVKRVR